jgi:hypothetical protein
MRTNTFVSVAAAAAYFVADAVAIDVNFNDPGMLHNALLRLSTHLAR